MPSWPSVLVGAVLVGALVGAAQKGGDEAPQAAPAAQPSPPVAATPEGPAAGPSAEPVPSPTWPDGVRATLPPAPTPRIALTFDDGPDPTWTPQVLDTLAEHAATATFCVVGDQITGREALLRRIHDEGHVLCNHSATHDYGLPVRGAERIQAEIDTVTAQLSAAVPDADVKVFRAPGGRFSPDVVDASERAGLESWAWSIDPQDWRTQDREAIVSSVLDEVAPGAVVLLHDGGGDRAATVAALGEILPVLGSVGYDFVGLEEQP